MAAGAPSPRPTRERARSVLAARRLYLTAALCLVWAHVCGPISTFLFGSNLRTQKLPYFATMK
jgi:hypothetical protein